MIDVQAVRTEHARAFALIWLIPAGLFSGFLKIADIPDDFRPYLEISWTMLLYLLVIVPVCLWLLDRRLKAALGALNAELAGLSLMAYAVGVSVLSYQGAQQALAPLFNHIDPRHPISQRAGSVGLSPQSLDEIGELTRAFAETVEREQETIRQLQESEQRFRMFAEASSDWFYEIDQDLKFSYVSDKPEEILGVPPENLVGLPATAMSAVYQETDYDPHREDLLARRPCRNYRFEVKNPAGKQFYLQVSGQPWFDAAGQFLGYRVPVPTSPGW